MRVENVNVLTFNQPHTRNRLWLRPNSVWQHSCSFQSLIVETFTNLTVAWRVRSPAHKEEKKSKSDFRGENTCPYGNQLGSICISNTSR